MNHRMTNDPLGAYDLLSVFTGNYDKSPEYMMNDLGMNEEEYYRYLEELNTALEELFGLKIEYNEVEKCYDVVNLGDKK